MSARNPHHQWLAEMNRRILAGRPVASADLKVLEQLYQECDDGWGPPGPPVRRCGTTESHLSTVLLSAMRAERPMH